MQTIEQSQPCFLDVANLKQSAETPGLAVETVGKSRLNVSCESEGKITVWKMN